MVIHGAKIYNEGVSLERSAEEKVQKLINVVKMISPGADISLRLVKNRRVFEVLLWGKVSGVPIGIFKRGISLATVLDSLNEKVKKDCVRAWKTSRRTESSQPLAMAG